MAKKRKTARKTMKRAKAAARRRSPRRKGGSSDETMNIVVGLLVVALIGLGIYFYQTNQKPKTGMLAPPAVVAMVVAN
jgi:cobalamin biosynthesis protein CobD/CbiB